MRGPRRPGRMGAVGRLWASTPRCKPLPSALMCGRRRSAARGQPGPFSHVAGPAHHPGVPTVVAGRVVAVLHPQVASNVASRPDTLR